MNRKPSLVRLFLFVLIPSGLFGNSADFSKIIRNITPSLVRVRSWVEHGEPSQHFDLSGAGTGTIISADGYVLTNAHVVTYHGSFKRFDRTEVLVPRRKYINAKVVGVDPENDLALLKVDLPESWGKLRAAKLEKNYKLLGHMVVKGGFPGVVVSDSPTFAHGFITNERAFFQGFSTPYFVSDSRLSQGDSGGPILNSKSRIVAIGTIMFTTDGVSLMVPAHIVSRVLPRLYKGDKKTGWLGLNHGHFLNLQDIQQDDDLKDKAGRYLKENGTILSELAEGLIIMGFADQKIGEAKLLKIGDVVLRINGKKPRDRPELIQWIAEQEPGSEIELIIVRDGKPMTLKLKVGEYEWKTKEEPTTPKH